MNGNNNNKEIRKIIAENIGKGEIRAECPNPHCKGSQKNTLCINTESGLYNCHRCGMKGNALPGGSLSVGSDKSAQEKAMGMLGNSFPADTFPYLREKQVRAYEGVREYHFKDGERVLLIPVMNSDGEIISVQMIFENGEKKFLKGTPKKGNFYKIKGNKIIFICEGYATGASIAEATGGTVYVVFDSGNILAVLDQIAPEHDVIIIGADNDHGTKDNPGLNKAISAALEYDNVKVVYPTDIEGTDFNDMMIEKGAEAVRERIGQAWMPIEEELAKQPERKTAPEPQVFNLTDFGNAERLIHRHGDNIRFSFEAGKWLVWNGKHWEFDNKGKIEQLTKETVRSIANEDEFRAIEKEYNDLKVQKDNKAEFGKLSESDQNEITKRINDLKPAVKELEKLYRHARNSENNARVKAMIGLGKTEPGVTVDLDDFDSDPWTFNCQNGTLDLRTGELRPHDRLDLNTKISPVTFDPAAECPLWDKFLDDIFQGDTELVRFMQRSAGYALTGDTSAEVFWVLYGKGGNGKGTFIRTVMSILSDYGKSAAFPLLCTPSARQSDNALNQLALLKGARFVSASEGEENAVLNESNIKNAVSSDSGEIIGRFKYCNQFSYTPEFKVFLATNHKPIIKGTDDGIWRRVMLIPFGKTFEGKERDNDLKTKLQAELPGVLNWMIRGCLDYQTQGLNPPDAVINATEKYRTEMDVLSDFLAESCEVSPDEKISVTELYKIYKEYCIESGTKPFGKQKFNKKLEEKGFVKKKGHGNKLFWFGLSVSDEPEQAKPETDIPEPEQAKPGNTRKNESEQGRIPCKACKHYNRHPEYCKYEGEGIAISSEKCEGKHFEINPN